MEDEQAFRLRRSVTKLARKFNASASDEGLTPSQASTLAAIYALGPVSLAEVARREYLNPSMMSRVVGRLAELDLIIRTPDPQDLRAVNLEVTPAGRETQERIKLQRARDIQRAADKLGPDEYAALVKALPALEELVSYLD